MVRLPGNILFLGTHHNAIGPKQIITLIIYLALSKGFLAGISAS